MGCELLVNAKFVALDTSHWRQWLSDAFSINGRARAAARRFYEEVSKAGFTILFCWHHLEELMAVEDRALAARRLTFIRGLPFLAWIGTVPEGDGLGAITDIMAAEVEAAIDGASVAAVRASAKSRLLRFGAGEDVIVDHPGYLSLVQWHAQSRVQSDRTITAIAPFHFLEPSSRVRDLMSQGMRSESEVRLALQAQHRALSKEISDRGDERITDAERRSFEFLESMLDLRRTLPNTARELVLGGYALCGIDADEIGEEATVGEMDRLVGFRCQLRVITGKLGLEFDSVKGKISPNQLPHDVIRAALLRHGQSRNRRPGSDLIDSYLAALGPYCDVLFVDRRTAEDFRRAKSREPSLHQILGRVEKAASYRDIPAVLRD